MIILTSYKNKEGKKCKRCKYYIRVNATKKKVVLTREINIESRKPNKIEIVIILYKFNDKINTREIWINTSNNFNYLF